MYRLLKCNLYSIEKQLPKNNLCRTQLKATKLSKVQNLNRPNPTHFSLPKTNISALVKQKSFQYSTFRNFPPEDPSTIPEEQLEEELLLDEIPLVESHWEAFESEIKQKLISELQATNVKVIDKTRPGCGVMLEIHVDSPLFESKSRVDQTRMVSNTLGSLLDEVHGITIKTKSS